MLGKLGALSEFSWLCRYSRPFLLPGKNVEIIYTPGKYYEALKVKTMQLVLLYTCLAVCFNFIMMSFLQHGVQTAERRVVWSSLYLGTGSRETELVCCQLRTRTD